MPPAGRTAAAGLSWQAAAPRWQHLQRAGLACAQPAPGKATTPAPAICCTWAQHTPTQPPTHLFVLLRPLLLIPRQIQRLDDLVRRAHSLQGLAPSGAHRALLPWGLLPQRRTVSGLQGGGGGSDE